MKTIQWFTLVAGLAVMVSSGYAQAPEAAAPGQAQATVPSTLSPGAAEVVRLATSGVGDDVVLAYIQNSQAPFNLSANDVLYLKDVGLSPQVTSAMITHDGTLRGQPQQYAPASAAPPPTYPAPAMQPAPAPAPAMAPAPAPVYVSSPPPEVSYFYSDLAPYGSWVQLDGVGWCWQPSAVVINRGWRPYCDGGSWVYSDLGWYWQSSYSWGWAPFHYGRWHMHPRCGWVWLPDRTWGPAWVTWRTAGDNCGWAPLPPRSTFDVRLGWCYNGVAVGANFGFNLGSDAFLFVSFGNVCQRNVRSYCLPPARVTTFYRQTTIVNNYTVVNNTVVHRGIPVERVSAVSHAAVPRATVRDWTAAPGKAPVRAGNVVYRPRLEAPARPVHMEAQRIDTQHPVIQHTPAAMPRVESRAATGRGYQAPAASTRQPAVESPRATPNSRTSRPETPAPSTAPAGRAPQTSNWSRDTQSASSPQRQPAASAPQAAPTTSSSSRAARAPDDWKQGTRAAPGYRSDTGLPALHNTPSASQSSPASSPAPNQHVYYPKGYYQNSEIHSLPPLDSTPSTSSSQRGTSSDSRGRKDR